MDFAPFAPATNIASADQTSIAVPLSVSSVEPGAEGSEALKLIGELTRLLAHQCSKPPTLSVFLKNPTAFPMSPMS